MAPIAYKYEECSILRFAKCNRMLSECIEDIKAILHREHYKSKKQLFTNQKALNLDKLESKRATGSNAQHTLDFVVGLKNNWLMPVEAKLGVKNVDNIKADIATKTKHSLNLLHSTDTFVHHTPFIIILLDGDNFNQKANRLKRLLGNETLYVIHTVESFYQTYFV